MTENKHVAFGLLFVAALVWAVAIVAAPVLGALGGPVSGMTYVLGSVICHQLPERSFHVAGVQLPVCARCAGVYVGAAIGLAAWALRLRRSSRPVGRERALAVLVVAAVPTAASVAAALLGVGDPANPWRAALALPLGLTGGAIAGAVASEHLK